MRNGLRDARRSGPQTPRGRGFTLVEMLVVLGVIVLLVGTSVGVYFAFVRTAAMLAEERAVLAVLQMARATALSEGAETFVCVDTDGGRIYPFGRSKVGVWSFEAIDGTGTYSPGAFGQGALFQGGEGRLADGKIGRALECDGTTYVKCKLFRAPSWTEIPTYDAREGVALEAWVAPVPAAAARFVILRREDWFGLELVRDESSGKYTLKGFAVTLDRSGPDYLEHSGETVPVIRPNEWTHVALACHKLSTGVTLAVNGVEQELASSGSQQAAAPSSARESAIGAAPDGADGFHGRIDAVVVSAYTVDTVHEVSRKLRLAAEGLAEGNTIRFGPSGRLSPEHEGATPRVRLQEMKGTEVLSTTTITIGAMGALDVSHSHP
jgi:prepilin-type N-terminal cleavage/methylation domain-containing protein